MALSQDTDTDVASDGRRAVAPIVAVVVAPPGGPDAAAELVERLDGVDAEAVLDVRQVPDAEGALAALDDGSSVDCVLTPDRLPESDGVDLLEAVRRRDSDLPVHLLAADGGEDVAIRAMEADVTDYRRLSEAVDRPADLATRIVDAVATYRRGRDAERALHELNDVAADPDLDFETKVRRFLDIGRERFGVEMGMLTREHEGSFEIRLMQGDHPELDEGTMTPPMTDNYCRRVVDEGNLVGVCDAGESGWESDALYHEFGLECYIGVQVSAGDEVFGTICFTDLSPRPRTFDEDDRAFVELMGRCVSYELERERREDHLTALNDLTRDLMEAETVEEVGTRVVEEASTSLGLPVTAVARYDSGEGGLEPVAATDPAAELLASTALTDVGDSPGWTAFVEGSVQRVDDLPTGEDAPAHPPITEVALFPLGTHGIALVGSTASGGFCSTDFEFAETVAATAETALDRADRERQLHERERTLEEQNEALERLNRVNDIIRDIDRSLVRASSRREIEQVVCEELAVAGPYELAWVGERDAPGDEIVSREAAGAADDYVDRITVTTDDEDPTGQGPAGRAVRTRELQVVNDIPSSPTFDPWRQEALGRGYHACAAIPLVYEDTLYGVLTVYSDQPEVFDDLERSVLAELGDNIAHAINAAESKRALVSEEVTDIEFRLQGGCEAIEFSEEFDGSLSLDTVFTGADGDLRGFFTARGVDPEHLREYAPRLPARSVEIVDEREEDGETVLLVEATLTDDSLAATFLEHGAVLREFEVRGGEATARVELPGDADVREFLEMVDSRFASAELVTKRSRERPRRSWDGFVATLREELTPRQLEVLETAYFSGFFEIPRSRTGSDIASSLDISQPTFNRHVRVAQRKLCRLLFERSAVES